MAIFCQSLLANKELIEPVFISQEMMKLKDRDYDLSSEKASKAMEFGTYVTGKGLQILHLFSVWSYFWSSFYKVTINHYLMLFPLFHYCMSHWISSRCPVVLPRLRKQASSQDRTQFNTIIMHSLPLWVSCFQSPNGSHPIMFIQEKISTAQLDVLLKHAAIGWNLYLICDKRRLIIFK